MKQLVKDYYERYLNRKEVMYRLPASTNINDFWPVLTEYRKAAGKEVALTDQMGSRFWFAVNGNLQDNIDFINKFASADVFETIPEGILKDIVNDMVLIDEAFNSSVIEGALSTRRRAQEIIRKNLAPAGRDEQMIVNNYKALEYALRNLHKHIDEDTILDIYGIVTLNTLDEADVVEKYRDDKVYVWDEARQSVVYEAPRHKKVQALMDDLVRFINDDNGIHPVIKASVIHFYLVYIHPFFDGNGRTARALSFMYLLKNGYGYFKLFSISSVLKEERSRYYKSLKDVEEYDSDLTYFINYMAEMTVKAIKLTWLLLKKEFAYSIIKHRMAVTKTFIPARIDRALKSYLKKDIPVVDVESHKRVYKTSYETARTDLNTLVSLGIFHKSKIGKKFIYKANEIDEILSHIRSAI